MAEITGYTAARMKRIEDETVVGGRIDARDHLILYTRDGEQIDAGVIKGGTAEWIAEYTPIVDEVVDLSNKNHKAIDEATADLQTYKARVAEVDRKITDLDETLEVKLPEIREKSDEASRKALESLQIANNSVAEIRTWFAVSNDGVNPPTTGWTTETVTRHPGQIIWWKQVSKNNVGVILEETAPAPLTGDKGDSPTLTYITSTNGTVFKRGIMDTTLIATVWHRGVKIEDLPSLKQNIGETAYLEWSWRLPATGASGIFLATDEKLSQGGFILHVTSDDVDVSAVFECAVHS